MVTMIEEPTAGTLMLDSKPIDPSQWASLRQSVQIVFQDPYGLLNPRHRTGAIFEEPLKINRPELSAAERTARAREMMDLVDLQERLQLAYLFISHDLSVVRHVADEVIVMYLGRAVEKGGRDAVFSAPFHPYAKALLSATPLADPDVKKERIQLKGKLPSPLAIPDGCPFAPRSRKAQDKCRSQRSVLPVDAHSAACVFPENGGKPAGV